MMSVWLAQVAAVIRLEMKKTFLSKRGLWVYLLALAPVAIWGLHSAIEMQGAEERRVLNAAHPVSTEVLESIQRGMSLEEVEEKAGAPHTKFNVNQRGRGRRMDVNQYTDGRDLFTFTFFNGNLAQVQRRTRDTVAEDNLIFAGVFQFFFLRLAVFFGCVGVFTNLFRGELLDKSLHYYLLAPLRREVLMLGKYIAGLTATTVIFTTSAALQMWVLSLHFDKAEYASYMDGPGWGNTFAYLGVTVAACLGYGSVFLAAGLLFKNPILPAALVEAWESANLFLPAVLKKISIIFYLQSLCPVVATPDADMPKILKLLINAAEPASAPVAILGLLAVTAGVLVIAGRQARRLEINYSTD
ncbi:MAG: hypothetical protein ABI811_00845 [Acidobacteriota bacterium]